jgi:archaellum component FlaF (FlaF/FlaG flagellin family)
MWEDAEKGIFRDNKRIRSAFKINDAKSVKSKNISKKENKVLEFLTINIEASENKNININLLFSGNMTISVNVEAINATLEDFSDSWKTKIKPVHKL